LESKKFQYSVLDEAQFIKNPDSKATIACMSIRSDYRIALTGTPVENHHFDIWTIFRYLMPGLLGNRFEFKKNYLEKPKEGIVRLQKQLTPFIIRRTKKEVIPELPDKMEFNLICPLTEKQRKEYIQIGNNCIQTYGEDLDELNSSNTMDLFTILTRLRQTACDPDLLPWTDAELNQSGKLSVLADKMEETIANNHKVVIFSQFVGLLKRVRACLEKRFPELVINELTGNTKNRSEPVQKFQRAKKPTVILVSLKAGGTGITLHNADYLFLMDPWWNPAVEEQAIDRVHRIGQKKTVMVFRMISEGTIEEKIQELKSHKKELFNKLVGKIPDVSILKNHVQSIKELITLK
jgi:SNF2 family DNA or RNA helicase